MRMDGWESETSREMNKKGVEERLYMVKGGKGSKRSPDSKRGKGEGRGGVRGRDVKSKKPS